MTLQTDRIHWLGHDSFRIDASLTVYIDPWEVSGPQADLILITHDHFDHCDTATVRALIGAKGLVVADPASVAKLRAEGVEAGGFTAVEPGDEIEFRGANIKAVPAYNLNKDFHPRAKNNLGYILTLDGLSIYHAGDTDHIPEMDDIRAQVALLPVSGTYTMTAEEAARAALAIKPDLAIPMHYGKIVGDADMAGAFARALAGKVPVEIKTQEK